MTRFSLVLALFGGLVAALVLRAIRRETVRVEYSLVWLFGAVGFVLVVTRPGWMDRAARLCGLESSALFIVLLALALLVLVCFHYAIILSRLRDDNISLVQKVAMLEFKLNQERRD
jgi:hypothetical protein